MPVDSKAATDRLMRFLAVEGVTGKEAAIGRELAAALQESGVPADAIRLDDANTRIPVPTETGNLIVDLPGRGAMHNQPRIMFMTHMDTVPLCAGAKPKLAGRKIVNEAKTALGGDNRAGCGVLVTLAAELAKQKLDHPPITLLFCVREESGLYGARHVKTAELGSPVDGLQLRRRLRLQCHDRRRRRGSLAGRDFRPRLACRRRAGARHQFDHDPGAGARRGEGRRLVRQGGEGQASRAPAMSVPSPAARAGRPATPPTSSPTMCMCAAKAAATTASSSRRSPRPTRRRSRRPPSASRTATARSGRVKFKAETDYYPFRMKDSLPVVKRAVAAVSGIGGTPVIRTANGGLDANWMVRHGIPTVTFGAGQNEVHTIDEWINLDEYDRACALAVQLATMRSDGLMP